MDNVIIALVSAIIVSFIFSVGLAAIYNVIIAIPRCHRIKKEKKYKTVTATRLAGSSQYEMEKLYENGRKYVFKYEWTIDGKTYRRRINTSVWPEPVDTFYYFNNPKYAVPDLDEIANFRYTKEVFFISFAFIFIFALIK